MKLSSLASVLTVAVAMTGCSFIRDQLKAKYLAGGNRYYASGQYQEAQVMYAKAIQADRRFGEAYYRAGMTAMRLQKWDQAARDLRIAVELQPKNEDAYARLIDVYCFVYTVNESVRPFIIEELKSIAERIHQYLPGTYDDERVKAYLALFSNYREDALESLNRANRIRPYQEEIISTWVKTLLAMGRVNEAIELALKAIEVKPRTLKFYDMLMTYYMRSGTTADVERIARLKIKNNPQVADGYLELAAQFFAVGNLAEMKSALRPIADKATEFPDAPLLLGDFYLRIRDWNSAAEYYQRGFEQGGKRKSAYQKRQVEVLVKQHKYGEALQLVQNLLRENPNDPEAVAIRASLPVITEDKPALAGAITDFRAVIGKLPEDFVLRYNYGQALILSRNMPAAVQSFKEALRLRPDYIWPRIRLAFITLDADKVGSTLELSRGILEEEGFNIPFETAGQRPQERPFYDEILRIRPDTHVVLTKLADALAAKHVAPDEAVAMSRRAKGQPAVRQ